MWQRQHITLRIIGGKQNPERREFFVFHAVSRKSQKNPHEPKLTREGSWWVLRPVVRQVSNPICSFVIRAIPASNWSLFLSQWDGMGCRCEYKLTFLALILRIGNRTHGGRLVRIVCRHHSEVESRPIGSFSLRDHF